MWSLKMSSTVSFPKKHSSTCQDLHEGCIFVNFIFSPFHQLYESMKLARVGTNYAKMKNQA